MTSPAPWWGKHRYSIALTGIILALSIAIATILVRDLSQTEPTTAPVVTQAVELVTEIASTTLAVITHATTSEPALPITLEYIEVTDGCASHFEGECLLVRGGPSTSSPIVAKLRTGIVLKVSEKIEAEGRTWYKIIFDEWLRYPDRVTSDWYVAADYVKAISTDGEILLTRDSPTTTKRIVVDRSEQMLYAYEGDTLFMTATTSTGLKTTPTPRGVFTIYKKTPSRYMQGPLPNINSDDYYDLPGVPWNLYFTEGGAVIHGAYWHNAFGTPYSHGCVNLTVAEAYTLYTWADVGSNVTVQD